MPNENDLNRLPRRSFFSLLGWGSLLGFGGLFSASGFRFMKPNVLYEPSLAFKAGYPSEYKIGEVSVRWINEQRTWIVREREGFTAILASCTHLGCTPLWFPEEDEFKCPCHGSAFNAEGDVLGGPAPQPLYRVAVTLADDGQLLVDKGVKENRPDKRTREPFFLKA